MSGNERVFIGGYCEKIVRLRDKCLHKGIRFDPTRLSQKSFLPLNLLKGVSKHADIQSSPLEAGVNNQQIGAFQTASSLLFLFLLLFANFFLLGICHWGVIF